VTLLRRCLDRSRDASVATPDVICDQLVTSDDQQRCISLDHYTGLCRLLHANNNDNSNDTAVVIVSDAC